MIALAIVVVLLPLAPAFAAALTPRARPLGAVAAVSGLATVAVAVALAIDVSNGRRMSRAQRVRLRRRAERLLSRDDRAGRGARKLRVGRVPAGGGAARTSCGHCRSGSTSSSSRSSLR